VDGFVAASRDGALHTIAVSPQDSARVEAAGPWHVHQNRGGFLYVCRGRYDRTSRANTTTWLHRFILDLRRGDPREVDFLNGNGLNCRRENLRIKTKSQRGQNMRKRTGTTSRYRGVARRRDTGRWTAYVCAGGSFKSLGCFDDERRAALAAARARRELFPLANEARHSAPGWEPTAGTKG
jgi:hypothetical protein